MKTHHNLLLLLFIAIPGLLRAEIPPQRRGNRAQDGTRPAVERYMHHLEQQDPETHARLAELKEKDPVAFRRELRRRAQQPASRERGRERQRRHQEFHQDVQAYHQAETDAEREQARAALQTRIEERVDQVIADRKEAITAIRERLHRLEELNEQELARRDEIVAHHLQRLLERTVETGPDGEAGP